MGPSQKTAAKQASMWSGELVEGFLSEWDNSWSQPILTGASLSIKNQIERFLNIIFSLLNVSVFLNVI